MKLHLQTFDLDEVFGIYKVRGEANRLPDRMRFLAPNASSSFHLAYAERPLKVSDMFRSADASLQAVQERRGAQPPGFSGHNYGFSIDLDVDWMLSSKGGRFVSKQGLDDFMLAHEWRCHRRDHKVEFECWHYNYDIEKYLRDDEKTTAPALERKIQAVYGKGFQLTAIEAQIALQGLKLYSGAIDGKLGPLSMQAVQAFQRTWTPSKSNYKTSQTLKAESGMLGPVTKRLLAYVSADVQVL